jgi:HrpA-like RNA helicase
MSDKLDINAKIGILDPEGAHPNPLTEEPYSQTYKSLAKVWSTFPAYAKADRILKSIASNQVTFIISGTGSGKTVLIPKFALHYTNYRGKIAITLPKRVVTLSAAAFAAQTLDVELGQSVGYVYKGSDKKMLGEKNKLIYMTDGSLIAKLSSDPTLSEYNIIIIDEAHERKVQIDLLLLFLKEILASGKRPDLRVIIMSATIDGPKYQNYFSGVSSEIINISGQPNHEIVVHFLDRPSGAYMVDGLDVIEKLIKEGVRKDMLFFITTSDEALRLCKTIRPKYPKIYCIEVYADMDNNLKLYAESSDKFLELGNYDQKLIMATNVAESSITIDGLKYVIDSGYELYSYFDPDHFAQILEKRLISKAQALQRRGRVGRTESGICYHLLTKAQFDGLADYPAPDILRQDITLDLIKIIQQTNEKTYAEGYELLHQLMDPPKKSYIDVATDILNLYKIIDDDGVLTKIGTEVNKFSSIAINRSLFLIYSFQMHCAKEASIILAMMEALKGKLSNLFFKADTICESGPSKPSSRKILQQLMSKRGDHFTFLNIYQTFKEVADQKTWAKKYGIRLDVLNKANKNISNYYYKIINISKAPQFDRAKSVDTDRRLLEALKLSHKHLTARKMMATYPIKVVDGQINKDSAVNFFYNRKELSTKTFIYDEFSSVNGNWEFNRVTLI